MQRTFYSVAFAGVLFAAANAFAEDASGAAKPDPRIGEEVHEICFVRNINGWKALKGVDNVVLLDRNVNDWHYVELQGYCPSRIFRQAEFIGIESRPSGGCLTRGDVIIVRDVGHFTNRCFVAKISKWDDRARAPREDEQAPPEDDTGTP